MQWATYIQASELTKCVIPHYCYFDGCDGFIINLAVLQSYLLLCEYPVINWKAN